MFFSHFCHNYHHNYHCNHHYHHHQKKFWSYAQNVVFDVLKKRTKLPELGSGGGGFRGSGQCPKENVFFLLRSSLSPTDYRSYWETYSQQGENNQPTKPNQDVGGVEAGHPAKVDSEASCGRGGEEEGPHYRDQSWNFQAFNFQLSEASSGRGGEEGPFYRDQALSPPCICWWLPISCSLRWEWLFSVLTIALISLFDNLPRMGSCLV